MNDKTGGSAFPAQPIYRIPSGDETCYPQNGMTLRDYFAAKAMQSILLTELPSKIPGRYSGMTVGQMIAAKSYETADAMLAVRGQHD